MASQIHSQRSRLSSMFQNLQGGGSGMAVKATKKGGRGPAGGGGGDGNNGGNGGGRGNGGGGGVKGAAKSAAGAKQAGAKQGGNGGKAGKAKERQQKERNQMVEDRRGAGKGAGGAEGGKKKGRGFQPKKKAAPLSAMEMDSQCVALSCRALRISFFSLTCDFRAPFSHFPSPQARIVQDWRGRGGRSRRPGDCRPRARGGRVKKPKPWPRRKAC